MSESTLTADQLTPELTPEQLNTVVDTMSERDFDRIWFAAQDKFGLTGTIFCRDDLNEEVSDDDWDTIRTSNAWSDLAELGSVAMFDSLEEAVFNALQD